MLNIFCTEKFKILFIKLLIISMITNFCFVYLTKYNQNFKGRFDDSTVTDNLRIQFNNFTLETFLSFLNENGVFLINHPFFNMKNETKVIAGVLNDQIEELSHKLEFQFKYDDRCYLELIEISDLKVITGINIDCWSFSIQVSVFYKRKTFYLILKANENFEYFGDLTRALNL